LWQSASHILFTVDLHSLPLIKKRQIEASADANSKTPEGIRYHASVEKVYREFLQECARTDSAGVENWQDKFEVLVTIGAQGTIGDNKIYAMGPVAVCAYHKLLNLKEQHAKAFPSPPQAPYLAKLDLDWADFAPVAIATMPAKPTSLLGM
jgi:hypothetical protein